MLGLGSLFLVSGDSDLRNELTEQLSNSEYKGKLVSLSSLSQLCPSSSLGMDPMVLVDWCSPELTNEPSTHALSDLMSQGRVILIDRITGAPNDDLAGLAHLDHVPRTDIENLFPTLRRECELLALRDNLRRMQRDNATRRRREKVVEDIASSTTLSSKERIDAYLKLGLEELGLDFALLSELDETNLSILESAPPGNPFPTGFTCPASWSFCHHFLYAEEPVSIDNTLVGASADVPAAKVFGLKSYIGCHISKRPSNRTTICFTSNQLRVELFTEEDREFVARLGRRIDVELQISDFKKALVESYDATLQGWTRAVDARDHETEGHCQRVAELTVILARRLGYPETELVHLRRGALLHDVGKIGIPDSILNKPGPLTDGEWEIMRSHPRLAAEMLAPIKFLSMAMDIPYSHHERWNGKGYPLGLSGRQIPWSARIFSVVDVFDALTSDRPYRNAITQEEALAEIRIGRGTLYDPEVVDAFLELMAEL